MLGVLLIWLCRPLIAVLEHFVELLKWKVSARTRNCEIHGDVRNSTGHTVLVNSIEVGFKPIYKYPVWKLQSTTTKGSNWQYVSW